MINFRFFTTHLISTFSLVFLFPTVCFSSIGDVVFVLGKVEKTDVEGLFSRVNKKTVFSNSDVIRTSKNGQLMLLMKDKSKITIRPNSTFKISDYSYTQNRETDKSHYNLVKGGFRFITGKMGKAKKSSYDLKTVVGTIGVRGTDFELNFCEADCTNDKGLFINVVSGGISLNNNGGSISISPGEFGHIETQNTKPSIVEKLPDVMVITEPVKKGNQKTLTSEKHATPEEQMVSISLKKSTSIKNISINELVQAGLSNNAILSGANKIGMEPASIVNAMIDSGVSPNQLIQMSMHQFPEHAANILTMAVAIRAINSEQANQLGRQGDIDPSKLKSAVTTGKLLRPPEAKKDNNIGDSNKKGSNTVKEPSKTVPQKRTQPKRVNPQLIPRDDNAGGQVPSPS